MTWDDYGPLITYFIGAFSLGWCAGKLFLTFRQVAEKVT